MTQMRYFTLMLATAISGAFLAIERFAFAPHTARWTAFGVAIGATVFSLSAGAVGLARVNRAFSGLSAAAAATAAWTIIAMLLFVAPTAPWLAFAGGVALLALSLAALAVHETTVERVVYALDGSALDRTTPAARASMERAVSLVDGRAAVAPRAAIRPPVSSWVYWVAHTALAATGAFVVLLTFAYSVPGSGVSLRWLAFAIGVAAAATASAAIVVAALNGVGPRSLDGKPSGRTAALLVSALSTAPAVALIVTMPVFAGTAARWIAFALGCGLAGASLLAMAVHEITSERVRHELEVAAPSLAPATAVASASPSSSPAA